MPYKFLQLLAPRVSIAATEKKHRLPFSDQTIFSRDQEIDLLPDDAAPLPRAYASSFQLLSQCNFLEMTIDFLGRNGTDAELAGIILKGSHAFTLRQIEQVLLDKNNSLQLRLDGTGINFFLAHVGGEILIVSAHFVPSSKRTQVDKRRFEDTFRYGTNNRVLFLEPL